MPGVGAAGRFATEWLMIRRSFPIHAALGAGLATLAAGPAATHQAGNGPLSRLEPGLWELRTDSGAAVASICLGDPGQLAQPQHRGRACERAVLSQDERSVTMRYSCPAAGSGRTVIRVETPRLVQVESQGLDRGTPFALELEARRTGACP